MRRACICDGVPELSCEVAGKDCAMYEGNHCPTCGCDFADDNDTEHVCPPGFHPNADLIGFQFGGEHGEVWTVSGPSAFSDTYVNVTSVSGKESCRATALVRAAVLREKAAVSS